LEGLRLWTLKQDGHGGHDDLRGSGRRSVIPYVHGKMRVVLQCAIQALALLFQSWVERTCLVLASARFFYSSRLGNYNETQGPTGERRAGKILCSRTLIARVKNDVFNGVDTSSLVTCHTALGQQCDVMVSSHFDTVAVPSEWSTLMASCCSRTVDACPHALQVLTTLSVCTSCRWMMALTWGALETCACVLRTCMPSWTNMSASLFFIIEARGPQDAMGHVAAPESVLAGR
jgi:hypothetical protein